MSDTLQLTFREQVRPEDCADVRAVVASTGFFYPEELDIAEELVRERLEKGPASGYYFIFADAEVDAGAEKSASGTDRLLGYACYGPSDADPTLIDLYWIAVRQSSRGSGLGAEILRRTEQRARDMGGGLLVAETSGRELYAPTRRFYERHGFFEAERVKDFYRPGDDKVVYHKRLEYKEPSVGNVPHPPHP
ncbi:GNAT family N-acetyltransferase [Desulfocurvibacter africanus]|uniref:GCN5-related N-acetyltransferase n=1 Tax=Desulfocurvibacter africanus subsp. africanus str. Walvis Bay TaxID=690850 RepID=F3Z3N8_DESAF|nr:GNAT family N-acetyltransferase [Desulfocurvibacter africanus]EGJ50410.1 GCN5-related N-acetyltransferase [Desulfocurvibacter africanus subsp. africanus str. Walvis Bay]